MRDYIIYFVTLTLTAALMYSFLALGFSPDILAMTENMSMLTTGILILSVLIAFMSSFVIGYAIRFMLGQRKKEFAAYELMGMEVKTVRNLFLVENGIIGGVAFLLGTLVGTGLSGLLNQVVQNIFEIPHTYRVLFSFRAWGMTLFFFILMYGFGMFRAAKVIRRQKVIDLLYDNQKNEEIRFQSLHRSVLTGLLSVAAMIAGVILLEKGLHIQTNEALLYFGGACLLILVGVYELHRNIPVLLYQFAKRNPHRKYREENLFFLGQIGRRIQSSGRTMAVVAILLTISLATMFLGLTMGAGYKANMEAYYPYDAGVAIDAPLTKNSMDSVLSFVDERCKVEDSVTYYLYAVPDEAIEALSLSDYNHLREILGLSPVSINNNEFFVHCDTWNYMDDIRQRLEQQPEITLNGQTLTVAETPILTEPMEQYQMAGTNGYVLVLPDEAASQLSGEKIRLVMKLEGGGYPELRSELRQFLNSGKWLPDIQPGQELPERVTMGVTVKAWGVANSLTGFTTLSFCGLYLSIIFIILSCSVLAFEQLSAIDKNQKNYAVIDRLGVSAQKQASLVRKELSTVFLIPLFFPIVLTILLVVGTQFIFGEAILQAGLVLFYGVITILLFCAIYLTYFGATMFLFKKVILRPEMR
ncbi:MFS family permease [Catenibacillus scindens]|uniref:MFS family permease n=1 Tax=Catenibacillus scindens TaxID=673271 RepID=A0A7W8HBL1_9FIRM|nr:ABC transporter permease [Catenibacillus scindens]MBB5265471.1 MFS family permease [Catenibacillus scindens]